MWCDSIILLWNFSFLTMRITFWLRTVNLFLTLLIESMKLRDSVSQLRKSSRTDASSMFFCQLVVWICHIQRYNFRFYFGKSASYLTIICWDFGPFFVIRYTLQEHKRVGNLHRNTMSVFLLSNVRQLWLRKYSKRLNIQVFVRNIFMFIKSSYFS